MFPIGAGVALYFLIVLLILGGLVGGLAGWLSSRAFGRPVRNLLPDILLGASTFLLVQLLAGTADTHASYLDGHAVGWRGVILNHQLLIAIGLAVVVVAGRRALRRGSASEKGAA